MSFSPYGNFNREDKIVIAIYCVVMHFCLVMLSLLFLFSIVVIIIPIA